MNNSLIELIKRNRLFSGVKILKLNSEFLNKTPVQLNPNQIVYNKDTFSNELYLVLSGRVNLISYNFLNRDKSKTNTSIFEQNTFFGHQELLAGQKRQSTCIALEKTELLVIAKSELNLLLIDNPDISQNINKPSIEITKVTEVPVPEIKRETRHFSKTQDTYNFRLKTKEYPTPVKEEEKPKGADYETLRVSLEKEKQIAEEVIQKEIDQISKREYELQQMEESLKKEKQFAEEELSREMQELSQKEKEISKLEEALLHEEAQAQELIRKKIAELKKQEDDIKKKNDALIEEKKLIQEAILKSQQIAVKELELLKRSKQLELEKKNVDKIISKEKLLNEREKELEIKYHKIDEEKKQLEESLKRERELIKKEEEIEGKLKLLVEERKRVEESRKIEKELNEKETALQHRFAELEKEREKINLLLDKEKELLAKEEELEKRLSEIRENESSFSSNKEQLHKQEQELKQRLNEVELEKNLVYEAKLKEEFLVEKEKQLLEVSQILEREKKLSEETLKKELELLEKRENEIKEREKFLQLEKEFAERSLQERIKEIEEREIALQKAGQKLAESELSANKDIERQLQEFKEREEMLLKRIQELEEQKRVEQKAEIKERVETVEEIKEEKIIQQEVRINPQPAAIDDSILNFEETISFQRDPTIIFQDFEFSGIKIVMINLQRGTANYAINLNTFLSNILRSKFKNVIIDLSYCEFLDSTMLGVLVKFLKRISYEGGQMKIVLNKDNSPSMMFFMSGMDRVFKIFPSLSSAISNFFQA